MSKIAEFARRWWASEKALSKIGDTHENQLAKTNMKKDARFLKAWNEFIMLTTFATENVEAKKQLAIGPKNDTDFVEERTKLKAVGRVQTKKHQNPQKNLETNRSETRKPQQRKLNDENSTKEHKNIETKKLGKRKPNDMSENTEPKNKKIYTEIKLGGTSSLFFDQQQLKKNGLKSFRVELKKTEKGKKKIIYSNEIKLQNAQLIH